MRRLPTGGAIDRSSRLAFRFGGRDHEGYAGDTLASALLGSGVDVVCPSLIHARARGVMTAGVEEPGALVEVTAPAFDAIVPATAVELVEGLEAAGRPGVGRLSADDAPTRCDHRHVHVETLVVGGGGSGLSAAVAAADRGERVMLVDERHWLGGLTPTEAASGGGWRADGIRSLVDPLSGADDVTLLPRATALGIYDDGYVVVHERGRSAHRLWHVRASRVILASGAHERPIAFADNDRPGVMLASAVALYLDRFAVAPSSKAVVFTATDSAYDAADALEAAGVEVVVVDVRAEDGRAGGYERLAGWRVSGTEGSPSLSAVHVENKNGTERRTIAADVLAVSGGWNPALQLYRAIGGTLRYDDATGSFLPDGGAPPWLEVVGRAAGGWPMAGAPYWFVPGPDLSRHYVDFQRDQTVADVAAAVDAGLRSVEHIKRATYIGTAVDQGRTSGAITAAIVNAHLGASPGAQGPTNARPPYTPVAYKAIAGRARGALFDPERRTPIHEWHVRHGAEFENVGQWRRPWFFPRHGEDLDAAVARECASVRTAVGMMDASTLGKIDVVGPDAAAFLDRMYVNRMSTLRVGRIRYGVMLSLDGMVMDDGVAMRLADDRYLVTTTTGGAAKVLDHFEEWLQTEWPDLRVFCTSVTEQWATIAVAGPRARDLLAAAGTDIDLAADAFPFMSFREGTVAGIPSRVARVSFSGELAFEMNVAGWHGLAMWEALVAAGEGFGVAPYGTEAMHVLRAEKGFIIVGQDTDGTVTPNDLGMASMVRADGGDFVGRRSLRRPDTARSDRKQLVGLLPVDLRARLPEGAQLVLDGAGGADASARAAGHVTSSYDSPALGRTFALGLLEDGRALHDTTVFAPLAEGDIAAVVTSPVLYDPDGARRDG